MLFATIFACIQSFSQWPWEKIEGNGHLQKETRELGKFTAVSSSGSWNVMISYGESNSLLVQADENLLGYIETRVENGTLYIKPRKNSNLHSKNKILIAVSLTRLTAVTLSGSGNISGEGNFSNDEKTLCKLSGSGKIQLGFHKINSVDLVISGSGSIRLSGSANTVEAKISGSGNADCSRLICEHATAQISGSGDIKLYANQSINANISGSGNITYQGAAIEIKKHVSGSGKLVKA